MTDQLIDVLASEARTALDDPEAVDLGGQTSSAYAIDRLDAIINALNPSEETRVAYAGTLKLLGMHIAERQDEIASELTYDEHDDATKSAYQEAHEHLTLALDHLDTAIGALAPEGVHREQLSL